MIYDPTLLLSPHIMLLRILFVNQAFLAPGLNHPDKLVSLNIYNRENELPLPFKPEVMDKLIFRRAVQTATGWTMSEDEPINKGMMQPTVKTIGKLVGFEHSTITYALRYMAGNNLDRDIQWAALVLQLSSSAKWKLQRQ